MARNGRVTRNYTLVHKRDCGVCQYCGEPGDTIDHLIPHAWRVNNDPLNMVVACSACNAVASSMMFESFDEKREYILGKRFPPVKKHLPMCVSECEAKKYCLLYGSCWLSEPVRVTRHLPDHREP